MQSVEIRGKYTWELILNIGPGNEADINRDEIVPTSLHVSRKTFTSALREIAAKRDSSISPEAIITLVNVFPKINCSLECISRLQSTDEVQHEFRQERTVNTKIDIKAGKSCKLYQLVFTAPGVAERLGTFTSEPTPVDDVIISCSFTVKYFLKDIQVVYTSDEISKPSTSIQAFDGKNADINGGFWRGSFVWLVPEWTTYPDEGVVGIELIVQSGSNANFKDLAKGKGGKYGYLKMMRDPHSRERISDVKLLRTYWSTEPSDRGMKMSTPDIKIGRGGDYLYLCWDTITI